MLKHGMHRRIIGPLFCPILAGIVKKKRKQQRVMKIIRRGTEEISLKILNAPFQKFFGNTHGGSRMENKTPFLLGIFRMVFT